jgi:hypothetical protein
MERTFAKDSVLVLTGAILLGLATHGQFWQPVIATLTNGSLTLVNLLAGGSGTVKVA